MSTQTFQQTVTIYAAFFSVNDCKRAVCLNCVGQQTIGHAKTSAKVHTGIHINT